MRRAQQKRVTCIGHGPIFFGPHYVSPWEDVWLRWHKGKPSKGMERAAPTLECAAEIVAELEMNEQIRNKPDSDEPDWLGEQRTPQAERSDWYLDEDAVGRAQLAELETQPFSDDVVLWKRDSPALATITTRANGIDRAEAERMLRWYLEKHYGLRNVKFVWKRPDFCVQPAGFGDYEDEDGA